MTERRLKILMTLDTGKYISIVLLKRHSKADKWVL